MKIRNLFFLYFLTVIVLACNNGPKVIEASQPSSSKVSNTGIFSENTPSQTTPQTSVSKEVHTVEVLEVLPTTKYVYLRVDENGEKYWLATGKKEINVGETYFYKNGILKTNFESKEHNRIFDKIFLVSNLVASNHGSESEAFPKDITVNVNQPKPQNPIIVEGSITIAELLENKQEYANSEVQVSGVCTKLNPNIMGRNWIHLKDGSKDDFDLVITSDVAVPEGHSVTMKGILVLDKDFGAGYSYSLIIENGKIVSSK